MNAGRLNIKAQKKTYLTSISRNNSVGEYIIPNEIDFEIFLKRHKNKGIKRVDTMY